MQNLSKFFMLMKYCWLDYKKDVFWFVQISVSPFFFALISLYMFRDLSKEEYIINVLLGSAIMGLWASTLLGTGNEISKERRLGTLEILLLSPTKLNIAIFSRACMHTLLGFFVFAEIFIISLFVTKQVVIIHNIPQCIFVAILTTVSFSVLGLLISAAFVLRREAAAFSNILSRVVYIFSGTMFPLILLPMPLRIFSYVLTPTWSIDLLRKLAIDNISFSQVMIQVGVIIGLTAIYYLMTVKLYSVIEERVLKNGDLRRV